MRPYNLLLVACCLLLVPAAWAEKATLLVGFFKSMAVCYQVHTKVSIARKKGKKALSGVKIPLAGCIAAYGGGKGRGWQNAAGVWRGNGA
jgi:hypothetical protein